MEDCLVPGVKYLNVKYPLVLHLAVESRNYTKTETWGEHIDKNVQNLEIKERERKREEDSGERQLEKEKASAKAINVRNRKEGSKRLRESERGTGRERASERQQRTT